jgi:hypothetical protein
MRESTSRNHANGSTPLRLHEVIKVRRIAAVLPPASLPKKCLQLQRKVHLRGYFENPEMCASEKYCSPCSSCLCLSSLARAISRSSRASLSGRLCTSNRYVGARCKSRHPLSIARKSGEQGVHERVLIGVCSIIRRLVDEYRGRLDRLMIINAQTGRIFTLNGS